jgi:hypothetical protein
MLQVLPGIDPVDGAGVEHSVNDRAFLPCIGMADEHPVFLSDLGRAELAFQQIRIESDVPVLKALFQCGPVVGCVTDGFAELALGDGHVGGVGVELCFYLLCDRQGVLCAQCFAPRITDRFFVPLLFEFVEFADQPHHELGLGGFVLDAVAELAESVRPAGRQDDTGVQRGVVAISGIGVALQNTAKSFNQLTHVFVAAVVDPFEHHAVSRRVGRPEVALPDAGEPSVDIFDKSFVDLKVGAFFSASVNPLVKWLQPHGHLFDDVALALPADLEPKPQELFLQAVEGLCSRYLLRAI